MGKQGVPLIRSCKIDVMTARAQKAGTSSLKAMLEQHPSINSHIPLECDYFAQDSDDWDAYYHAHFGSDAMSKVTLGKLAHLAQSPWYLTKLYEHNSRASRRCVEGPFV